MEKLATNSQASAQPSACKCGKAILPVSCGVLTLTPQWCPQCSVEKQRIMAEREVADAKREIEDRIDRIIPPKCRPAELSDLPGELVESFNSLSGGQGVYLWGDVGVGKTWAMAALAKHYIRKRKWVKRVVWGHLLYHIKRTYNNNALSEYDVIQPLMDAHKLFLEDAGSTTNLNEHESSFAIRVLQMLLDYRVEHELPLFITSNISIENLALSFDERIASRIQGDCIVARLEGTDRRLQG